MESGGFTNVEPVQLSQDRRWNPASLSVQLLHDYTQCWEGGQLLPAAV